MEEELQLESKDFDCVVFGTGLTECLVSAALARIGKSVLHLDKNPYYGGSCASLPLDSFHELLTQASQTTVSSTLASDFSWSPVTKIHSPEYSGPQTITNVAVKERAEGVEDLLTNAGACRRCSIDLVPKAIWSRSLVIDTLIRAGASRYLEFKTIQHLYLQTKEEMVQVPVSKADVFKTTDISLIEKRQLMKFITTITQPDEKEQQLLESHANNPFVEYMKAKKLTSRLITFLLYAVALEPNHFSSPSAMPTSQGVSAILKFMSSVGRYGGNSPWIYPLFGLSELCQSFSRLSAIYGATFILSKYASDLLTEVDASNGSTRVTGFNIGNTKDIKTKHIVSNFEHLPELAQPYNVSTSSSLSRCVIISDKPLKSKEDVKENIVTIIPPQTFEHPYAINIIQLDESASVVPAGRYLWQLWTRGSGAGAESDLKEAADALVAASGALVSYNAYWSYVERKLREDIPIPSNVHLTDAISFEVGPDDYFSRAERIFQQICPDEEFIPLVPNPDDIMWTADEEDGDQQPESGEQKSSQTEDEPELSSFEQAAAETPEDTSTQQNGGTSDE